MKNGAAAPPPRAAPTRGTLSRCRPVLFLLLAGCSTARVLPHEILEAEVVKVEHRFDADGTERCVATLEADEVTATISTENPGECLRLGRPGNRVCIAREPGPVLRFRIVPCPKLPCRRCSQV